MPENEPRELSLGEALNAWQQFEHWFLPFQKIPALLMTVVHAEQRANDAELRAQQATQSATQIIEEAQRQATEQKRQCEEECQQKVQEAVNQEHNIRLSEQEKTATLLASAREELLSIQNDIALHRQTLISCERDEQAAHDFLLKMQAAQDVELAKRQQELETLQQAITAHRLEASNELAVLQAEQESARNIVKALVHTKQELEDRIRALLLFTSKITSEMQGK